MNSQKKYKLFKAAAVIAFLCFFTNCRKNISVPNQESEKLFGAWAWVQTSGGESPKVSDPSTNGYDMSIEFDKNGIYKTFRNKKQTEKLKFTLIEGTSTLFKTNSCFIKFKPINILHKNPNFDNCIAGFHGNDTLIISNDAYDGFTSIYVRKK